MSFFHAASLPGKLLENRDTCKFVYINLALCEINSYPIFYFRLRIDYDLRNSTLRASLMNFDESIDNHAPNKGVFDSFFHPNDVIEGPFSKTSSYFAETKVGIVNFII